MLHAPHRWIHNHPYGNGYNPLKEAAKCYDRKPDCKAKAEEGLCDTDPARMLGLQGECRKSCDDCVDCHETDLICLRRNMRSQRQRRKAGLQ